MLRPHLVILGAGFGGVYVGKKLARQVRRGELDITIVNRTNYFLFTPLLHEVATGALSPSSVAEPLREVFADTSIRIVQASVKQIDLAKRQVHLTENETATLDYDYLIIATGAETNYYGCEGAAELTLPLKSLADAVAIRHRVIDVFEQAVLLDDPEARKKLLSFAVVGGGPTGVELAAELAEFTRGITCRYYNGEHCLSDGRGSCQPEEVTITLVNAGKEILEPFSPALRAAARAKLEREGVIVRNGVSATKITAQGLVTATGETISASMVMWAAGVKATAPAFLGEAPTMVAGRLAVDESFRLQGQERVFALGDVAAYFNPEAVKEVSSPVPTPTTTATVPTPVKLPRPLPMLAQVASGEARIVAANIAAAIAGRSPQSFRYHSKGSMVSVGQWFAIGQIFGLRLSGRLTWWLWRTIYLFKFASRKKRLRIAFEWFLELFFPRDITKL